MSVRQAGMGDVSAGGADLFQAWTNPALLAGQGRQTVLAAAGSSMFGGGQARTGIGGGWIVAPGWTVAGLVNTCGADAAGVDENGEPTGVSLTRRLTVGGLAAAGRFGPYALGVAVKGMRDEVAGDGATAVAADIGGAVSLGWLLAGVAVRNAGSAVRGGDPLPLELRGGVSIRHAPRSLRAGVEAVSVRGAGMSAGAGVEWWATRSFGVRAGAPIAGGAGTAAFTFGLSAVYRSLALDYAVATHPLGLSHVVGLSAAFGPDAAALEQRRRREGCKSPYSTKLKDGKLVVAAAPLSSQNVPAGDAVIVSELLWVALVKAGGFNVVEKRNMDAILTEQQFQQYGCTDEECVVRMGRLLNVQAMFMGTYGLIEGKYVLSLRAVDVETGGAVYADSISASAARKLEGPIRDFALRASRHLVCVAVVDPEAEYRAAVDLYNAGNHEEALSRARVAIDGNPAHAGAWQIVGNCLYAKGDRAGALDAFNRSLKINPGNTELKNWVDQLGRQ
jgi:hypothetical protein